MSKTWYGHHIETIKGEDYVLFKDYLELDKKIDQLNNMIDTILDFSFLKEECPLNFGLSDEKEEKAQDVFYEDEWCEKNCNDEYKKCWLKYFERLIELKGDKK